MELTDSAIALSTPELKSGYILACQSIARRSLELDVEGLADMPDHLLVHRHGTVSSHEHITHDIQRVTITLDEPLAYSAGQYAELRFAEMSGPRSYSFAEPPERAVGNDVSFFVRRVPGGEFTGWLFESDRVGESVEVAGPFGNMWLRPADAPILLVAGGSGLAPLKAILESAVENGVDRDAVIVFGAREQRDLYCLDELEDIEMAWKGEFSFRPVLSEEATDSSWEADRGLVTDVVKDLGDDFIASCETYTCGPPVMIDALEDMMRSLRTGSFPFHADRFVTRQAPHLG
jgi:NAD(P)H-flavin reductase